MRDLKEKSRSRAKVKSPVTANKSTLDVQTATHKINRRNSEKLRQQSLMQTIANSNRTRTKIKSPKSSYSSLAK